MSQSTPHYPVAWPASVWCSALRLHQGGGWDQCWETSAWLVLGNEHHGRQWPSEMLGELPALGSVMYV
jgi:hypothetical protein